MAEITLKYDARNVIAKKTIDYILSIGVFKSNAKNSQNIPVTKTIIKEIKLTAKDEVFLKKIRKLGSDCRGIKNGTNKTKYKSLQTLLDEL